jgi:hypothetical protein
MNGNRLEVIGKRAVAQVLNGERNVAELRNSVFQLLSS